LALTPVAEKRVALVIGNGAYVKVPSLPNPTSDATAMAAPSSVAQGRQELPPLSEAEREHVTRAGTAKPFSRGAKKDSRRDGENFSTAVGITAASDRSSTSRRQPRTPTAMPSKAGVSDACLHFVLI